MLDPDLEMWGGGAVSQKMFSAPWGIINFVVGGGGNAFLREKQISFLLQRYYPECLVN